VAGSHCFSAMSHFRLRPGGVCRYAWRFVIPVSTVTCGTPNSELQPPHLIVGCVEKRGPRSEKIIRNGVAPVGRTAHWKITMVDNEDVSRCEQALRAVLPVFEIIITYPNPNQVIDVTNLEAAERKRRSFCVQFLVEVRHLRDLLENAEDRQQLKKDTNEYMKNLNGIMNLFDCNVLDIVEDEASGMKPLVRAFSPSATSSLESPNND
jgi:hypothetical protein